MKRQEAVGGLGVDHTSMSSLLVDTREPLCMDRCVGQCPADTRVHSGQVRTGYGAGDLVPRLLLRFQAYRGRTHR